MKSIFLMPIAFSASCTTMAPIEVRESWSRIETPIEVSTLSHASCFADDHNFYVFSGIDERGEGPLSNVGYTYNIKRRSWEKWSNESGPVPIQNFASAKTDDHIYIFGGQDADSSNGTNKFYRYDLRKNVWETLPVSDAVDGRWRSATHLNDKGYLVYGGKGDKEALNTAYFDFESEQWNLISTPNEVGTRVSEIFVNSEDNILVLGGFIGQNPQESGFVLDLKSRRWTQLSNPILGPRVNAKFLTTDSKLYVIGGSIRFDTQAFGAIYDFKGESWTPLPNINGFTDLKGYEITLVKDEGILLAGGRHPKDNTYNDKWHFYKFKTKSWTELKFKNSPPGTVGGCLVSNPQREVFVLGGIMNTKGMGLKNSEGLWRLNAAEEN
ncbi:MAG: kelch repeat-containing protein [Proteobacteria bacterium]|nr:MAG: kelch repeat-containing protein [Pseudomonadota bacterium]